jgi:hypothetical protein
MEGVWSFEGGQVAVQKQSDGSLMGTVIRETKFAVCFHPVGEQMWTQVTGRADGTFQGFHRWYHGSSAATCTPYPDLGPTAWKVETAPDGSRDLLVCFRRPSGTSGTTGDAPTFNSDGSVINADWGCTRSALIRPLPTEPLTVASFATLPQASFPPSTRSQSQSRRARTVFKCRSRRNFTIRLRHPRGDALTSATVRVNGKVVATRHGRRVTAPINLRRLPKGRYTVTIRAKTVLGRTVTETRRYRTCTPKRKSKPAKIKVKNPPSRQRAA